MDVKSTDPLFCAEPELSDVPVLFELVRIVNPKPWQNTFAGVLLKIVLGKVVTNYQS